MFCPKCATQNMDGARFCRSCGLDISLVPQAMTGSIQPAYSNEMIAEGESEHKGKRGKQPSIESGIRNIFVGLGFLCVAIALSFSGNGRGWWFWMLIPAFSMMGGGVAEYLRGRKAEDRTQFQPEGMRPASLHSPVVNEFQRRGTSDLMSPPPSVTEGTTRHLGAESATKIFAPAERPKQES